MCSTPHQSGVGKSSIINTTFGINKAVELSHLFVMSVPQWLSLSAPPTSSAESQIFKRGSNHLSINGSSFMIPLASSTGIRITMKPSRRSSKAGKPGHLKTNCMQFGEMSFSCDSIACLIILFQVLRSNPSGRRTATRGSC
jgi:hypothetical protein